MLVDEYDKPILDALEDPELARASREYLRELCGMIMSCDGHIPFSFPTEVSKFSSIFRTRNKCDNLNTHAQGAFDEAFEPKRAKQLVERVEFRYTPQHGCWLNIAESELSCMPCHCFQHRRIGDLETLRSQIQTWSSDVNERQRGVDWHMTVEAAHCKPKSVCPRILL